MNPSANLPIRRVPTAALLPFTLVTFAISWGILGLFGIPLVFAAGAAFKGTLLPGLFHFQVNNPLWPDAQPCDTNFFLVVAVVVVWVNRRTMLSRDDGVAAIFTSDNPARLAP